MCVGDGGVGGAIVAADVVADQLPVAPGHDIVGEALVRFWPPTRAGTA